MVRRERAHTRVRDPCYAEFGGCAMKTSAELTKHGITPSMDRIGDVCRKYDVRELSVFGSFLLEAFRPESDIDFLGAEWRSHKRIRGSRRNETDARQWKIKAIWAPPWCRTEVTASQWDHTKPAQPDERGGKLAHKPQPV
jgi:hypothetical protein